MGARGRRRDGRRGDEGDEGRGDEGRRRGRGDEGEGEDKMQGIVVVDQTREEGEKEKQQKQPDDLPELMETLASFSIRS